MNTLKATKRNTSSSGQINKLRLEGFIPAILYGGKESNLKISLKKFYLQDLLKTETFMSKVVDLDIDGKPEKALPREISYHPISDEPIHIDFIRIVKGTTVVLEIPVKFINSEKSPGLKKGGVLNTVRRKVELKCPAENIPNEIIVDLNNTEINTSLKISSVKLPENVVPTISDRDFVIATIAPPTVLVEPVKTEEGTEGEAGTDDTTESTADASGTAEDGKDKSAKSTDDKTKTVMDDKNKSTSKEKEIKKK